MVKAEGRRLKEEVECCWAETTQGAVLQRFLTLSPTISGLLTSELCFRVAHVDHDGRALRLLSAQ
jgi:hypothetical protein